MQDIIVEAPDGTEITFPQGTDTATIERVMQENYGRGQSTQARAQAPRPTLLGGASRVAGGVARAGRGVLDAFTGADAPFQDAGEVGSRAGRSGDPLGASLRTGAGFALTNDEARRVGILREQYPQAEFTTDQGLARERGVDWPEGRVPRTMVRVQPGEDYRFINAPGFSAQDVNDLASGALAFLPASRFAGKGGSLGTRMLRGGAAAAGTQAGLDEASRLFGSDEGADIVRSGVAGLMQAGSEPLVTLGGVLFRRSGAGRGPALDEAGAAALNNNPAMTPVEAVQSGRGAGAPGAVGADQAARRALADEFEIPLTRGQQARDPNQINSELMMMRGMHSPAARDQIRPFMQGQAEAAETAARRFGGEGMPQGPRSAIEREAGDTLASTVRGGADDLWRQIDDAYDVARGMDARFDAEAVRGLPRAADDWLAANDVILDPNLMPAAAAARNRLAALVQEIDALPTEAGESVVGVSLHRIEQTRRQILNLAETAQSNGDRMAARRVREALDSWTDRAIDDALISGDEAALDALRGARGLRARYARAYSERAGRRRDGSIQPDPAGRLIRQIAEDELTGTEVVNLLWGRSAIGNQRGTARAVERMVSELGSESAEVAAIRQAYIARLMRRLPSTENPGGFTATLARDWRDAINGPGAEITRALFSRAERAQMTRYARLLEELTPPDGAARSSGTAENAARLLGEATRNLLDRFPVAGPAIRRIALGADDSGAAQARRAIQPPRPALTGPRATGARVGAGASGSFIENRYGTNSPPPR
jgi:hypothetical protein